jgi:hypothetical protein
LISTFASAAIRGKIGFNFFGELGFAFLLFFLKGGFNYVVPKKWGVLLFATIYFYTWHQGVITKIIFMKIMSGGIKFIGLLKFLFILLASYNAYATKPCVAPDQKWFKENVASKSDLVVYGKIAAISAVNVDEPQNWTKDNWTKFTIINKLFAKGEVPQTILIQDWQADLQPFYNYHQGDFLVLWLKKKGQHYILTDLSWDNCLPSIWEANGNGQFKPQISSYRKWLKLNNIKEFL